MPQAAVPRQTDGAPLRRIAWNALGTVCDVQFACADDRAAAAFEAEAVAWVRDFEAKYSRFREMSALSRINAAAGGDWVPIDAEMGQFLDLCGSLHQVTRGVLDVTALPLMRLWDYRIKRQTLPTPAEIDAAKRLVGWSKVQRQPGRVRLPLAGMALDFGGWGKEYAVDMVAQIARRRGLTAALVDFGRDHYAVGGAPGKPGWHIGIEDPSNPGRDCWGSLAARDSGVASSGDYVRGFIHEGRRYGHILDPRTGVPVANGCRQVTVIAKSCLQAGVLSTAAFVLGAEAGIALIEELPGAEGCIVTERGRHKSKGFYRHEVTH